MDAITDLPLQPPSRDATLALVRMLKQFYEHFSADTLAQLDAIYTPDVEFRDPIHTLHGNLAVKRYLKRMAANLTHYRIRYLDECVSEHSAYFTWEMEYAHRRVNRGEMVVVRGMTQVKFTSKVFYHEDSYDLGALLYEHLPVLGSATRYLKFRMAR